MNSRSGVKTDSADALCDITCVNETLCRKILGKLPDDDKLYIISGLFKAFGDPTRLKILKALSISELCVCDIAAISGVSQSAISHQLRYLRMSRLVKYRRDGKMAYYSLDDEHVRSLLEIGQSHVEEVE